MRTQWGALKIAVAMLLLAIAPLSSAQDDSGPQCPAPVNNYADLFFALGCQEILCEKIDSCDEVLLAGNDSFAFESPDPSVPTFVLRNVTVLGSPTIVWNMGEMENAFRVEKGVTLKLKDISVEAVLSTALDSFLQPKSVKLEEGSLLALDDVTYLTSGNLFNAARDFARDNLPSNVFRIQPEGSGPRSLHIDMYASDRVSASNVTIEQWAFPKSDNEGRVSVEVTHSEMMKQVLEDYDTPDWKEVSEMDIMSDIVIDPEDWPEKGITLKRNLTIAGVELRHQSVHRIPLLDLRLVKSAVTITPGAVVEMKNLEIINLALGPLDAHYGFLMHFFDFDRNKDGLAIVIRNSKLVVSCPEIENFEYAAALLGDPIQTLVREVALLKLNPENWKVESKDMGLINVEAASAYGIELHNVNLTCGKSRGDVLEVDFQLGSPLTLPSTATPRPPGSPGSPGPPGTPQDPSVTEQGTADVPSPETNSTMFRVLLGVLVPLVTLLSVLLIYKIYHNRNAKRMKAMNRRSRKSMEDVEEGGSPREPASPTFDKELKKTMSEKFQLEDHLDEVPSHNSPVMLEYGAGQLLSPANAGSFQAAEFLPAIVGISKEIDDKQLVMKELLGEGQHATVHKGVWRELPVAVKTIVFRGEYDSEDYHQSAIQEVAITSGLSHNNIVCTYSYDIKRLQPTHTEARVVGLQKKAGVNVMDSCVDWKLFIIQEYCEMGTLENALKKRMFVDQRTGNPDLESLLEIASGIVKGMLHIHSKNILHGNLKPCNVLLKKSEDTHTKMLAKIADFGLSHKLTSDQTHVSNAQQGTPFYTAREVLEKGSASKAADVYAFGVMLWEMYTSQLSPTGTYTPEMYSQFPRLPWSCPAPYGALAIACMHPVPSARPSFCDVMELLWAVWQQKQRLGALVPPPAVPSRQNKARNCTQMVSGTCPTLKCIIENQSSDKSVLPPDDECEKARDRRRAYYWKALSVVPEMFKNIEYEQVYWPENDFGAIQD